MWIVPETANRNRDLVIVSQQTEINLPPNPILPILFWAAFILGRGSREVGLVSADQNQRKTGGLDGDE